MKRFILLPFFLLCQPLLAENFHGEIRVGGGSLELKEKFTIDDYNSGDHLKGVGLSIGYTWDNNVVLDVGIESTSEDIIAFLDFDSMSFFSRNIAVGYRFGNEKIYWVPQIGYSRWDLDFEEGQFLNPGPEERMELAEGEDLFWKLTAGYKISKNFAFTFSFRQLDTHIGKSNASMLGFVVEFDTKGWFD